MPFVGKILGISSLNSAVRLNNVSFISTIFLQISYKEDSFSHFPTLPFFQELALKSATWSKLPRTGFQLSEVLQKSASQFFKELSCRFDLHAWGLCESTGDTEHKSQMTFLLLESHRPVTPVVWFPSQWSPCLSYSCFQIHWLSLKKKKKKTVFPAVPLSDGILLQ